MEEELGILLQKQEQIVMKKHISFSYLVMERNGWVFGNFKKYLDGHL